MTFAPFIHLMGSVPLSNTKEVFQTVCEQLPGRLLLIPDGETGDRNKFVLWQWGRIWPEEVRANMRSSEPIPNDNFVLTKDHLPTTTGYVEHAIASYNIFRERRETGLIPPGVRFQVCVPSPTTLVGLTLDATYQLVGEQLYENLLFADLKTLQEQIPHQDLAIQWDILAELFFMEHASGKEREPSEGQGWFWEQLRPFFSPVREGIVERVSRLGVPIHHDAEMGFHTCYGDALHKHFIEPIDSGFLADVVRIALEKIPRQIDWVHIPVPINRNDEAYLEPLKALIAVLGKTKLVLGLVHAQDHKRTGERISAAQRVLPGVEFGISTECGLGRTSKEDLESVFQICRDYSDPQHQPISLGAA